LPVVLGSDNVGDAFCPMGQHDPRAALHLAALAAHLDPPMGDWLPTITLHAAAALGLDPGHIEICRSDQLRLCSATSTADLVAGRAPLLPLPADQEVATP
jgi:cytosine deaminase